MRFLTLKVKFYKHVLLPNENGCMLWASSKTLPDWRGYGETRDRGGHRVLAHHLSFRLHVGDIPEGFLILHTCDNRACVAPDHLYLGTASDNAKDRHRRNRDNQPAGENQYLAKFTNQQAREIREEYNLHGVTTRQLAKKYRVTQATIQYLLARKTYKSA
jgi:hypothetical protein